MGSLNRTIGIKVYSELNGSLNNLNNDTEAFQKWGDNLILGSDFSDNDSIYLNKIKDNILAIRDDLPTKIIPMSEIALIDSQLATKPDFINFSEKFNSSIKDLYNGDSQWLSIS